MSTGLIAALGLKPPKNAAAGKPADVAKGDAAQLEAKQKIQAAVAYAASLSDPGHKAELAKALTAADALRRSAARSGQRRRRRRSRRSMRRWPRPKRSRERARRPGPSRRLQVRNLLLA